MKLYSKGENYIENVKFCSKMRKYLGLTEDTPRLWPDCCSHVCDTYSGRWRHHAQHKKFSKYSVTYLFTDLSLLLIRYLVRFPVENERFALDCLAKT